ncbi:MAG: hypothetical protein K0S75_650 [Clostridia bacterium]|jgi:hypothetical protein|nr:hypothetical protein [Clostridia bacterium]
MSKKHCHHHCPSEEEEIYDRILRRCGCDRRPNGLLPANLSPQEVRELRCILESLRRCICRPNGDFRGVEGEEDFLRRSVEEDFQRRR